MFSHDSNLTESDVETILYSWEKARKEWNQSRFFNSIIYYNNRTYLIDGWHKQIKDVTDEWKNSIF